MHRWAIVAGFLLAFLAGPATAAAPAAQAMLEPTTQWRIDYGPERCSLLRQFGEVKDGVLLEIASFGSRSMFRVTLIGKPVPNPQSPSGRIKLRLTPDTQDRELPALRGTVPDKTAAVLFSTKFTTFDEERDGGSSRKTSQEELDLAAIPSPPEAAFEEQTISLAVKFGSAKQVALHTGRMTKPLAALRTCVDSLEKSWGLDPVAQTALTRQAVLIPSTIKAIQANYPADMTQNGLSAYVPVRVMVDAAGKPGACVIQSDGVDPAFAKAVCDGFTRPFKPALDAQGLPIASVYITAVIFRVD